MPLRMNARKEQAGRIPLTQPAFEKQEREEERKPSAYEMVQLHFRHLGGGVRDY